MQDIPSIEYSDQSPLFTTTTMTPDNLFAGAISTCQTSSNTANSTRVTAQTTPRQPCQAVRLCSLMQDSLTKHIINPNAAGYSNILHAPLRRSTPIIVIKNMSDAHTCFAVELLNHIELVYQGEDTIEPMPENSKQVIEFIIMRTENFTTISLSDVIRLIRFFDIPIGLNALLSLRTPLPFPTTLVEEVAYNKQLLYIFRLRHLANGAFLELFGSMIYPRYITYPECLRMIQFYYFYKERLAPQSAINPIFELANDLEQGQTEHVI
jgi:hypothetical protein